MHKRLSETLRNLMPISKQKKRGGAGRGMGGVGKFAAIVECRHCPLVLVGVGLVGSGEDNVVESGLLLIRRRKKKLRTVAEFSPFRATL